MIKVMDEDDYQDIIDTGNLIRPFYKEVEYIGAGGDGIVFKVTKHDNTVFAAKVGFDNGEIAKLEILKDGCVANLVSCYYGSYKLPNGQDVIEMEYIDGWRVDEFIELHAKTLDEVYYYLLLITMDVLKALKYINSKGIFHGDVGGGNILINKITKVPKLIDFGLAEYIRPGKGIWMLNEDINMYKSSSNILVIRWLHRHGLMPRDGKLEIYPNTKLFKTVTDDMAMLSPDEIITLIENNIIRPSSLNN